MKNKLVGYEEEHLRWRLWNIKNVHAEAQLWWRKSLFENTYDEHSRWRTSKMKKMYSENNAHMTNSNDEEHLSTCMKQMRITKDMCDTVSDCLDAWLQCGEYGFRHSSRWLLHKDLDQIFRSQFLHTSNSKLHVLEQWFLNFLKLRTGTIFMLFFVDHWWQIFLPFPTVLMFIYAWILILIKIRLKYYTFSRLSQ